MTYALAWKLGPAVYLAGDTALTDSCRINEKCTSFGEEPIDRPDRCVYEGCLKLVNFGTAAVAICGDVALARSVIEVFKKTLQRTNEPRAALQTAIASCGPVDPERSIHLLVAFPDSPAPALLSFNHAGDQSIIEHDDGYLVQIGSITPIYKSMSHQMITNLRPFRLEPQRFLVNMLGFLQSLGVHDYLLEYGVGGVFCGLLVGEHSIEWQKDILFCVHNELDPNLDMVSCIVRDNVIVVRSTFSNSCRYFADTLACGSFEEWKSKWWDPAFDFAEAGRFDFVVILNRRCWIVNVVEMLKHLSSAFLRIEPTTGVGPNESFRIQFQFSPMLTKAMTEPLPERHNRSVPFKLNWFPYKVEENGTP